MGSGDSGNDTLDELVPEHRSLDTLIPGDRSTPSSLGERVAHWFLLRGKRAHVTLVLLVAVLVVLLLLSVVRPVDVYALLNDTNTVQTLFNTLLSGMILLVSVVVSINSIVLSEEITDIEHQRERIDASIRYRGQIEQFIEGDVSPARPAEFLRAILKIIDQQSSTLADIAARSDDEEFRREAKTFSDNITDEAERAGETLTDAQFGTFRVLLAGLNYDYSWQLHVARRFQRKYGEGLDDDEQAAIEDIVETLKVFATGREYFKSLYYKREFAHLSSRLLYVSLPAIIVTSYVLLALDTNLFPQVSLFALSPLMIFVSVAYTIALVPYLMLTAYVLRAMAVTLRTLASGPFILESGGGFENFDWEEDDVEVSDPNIPTEHDERTADERTDDEQEDERAAEKKRTDERTAEDD
ncbi:hypothetical protein [Halorussus sp. MSC15.2]|uniref:hypothetical protein n=1 Tax=Halorussus sp. MSC15.2 TaxID=2283638 RepID=UPI0013D3396D|nr:hypothetical protein [Halorussus sp. MSC15.2]NEU55774.1 hypothetical protein [Halorussus sp. MSC15.2]